MHYVQKVQKSKIWINVWFKCMRYYNENNPKGDNNGLAEIECDTRKIIE